jgi:hypothetical protein
VVWLAGRIVCISRARPASKFHRERVKKALNCPGHGTSFGKASRFPKGTFKARTSKGIFSQFLVFRLGLRKMRAPKLASKLRTEGHTVARVRAPDPASPSEPCHSERLYREEPAVRWQLSRPRSIPNVEIIWKFCGKRSLTGLRRACMFVRFRGQSVLLRQDRLD